MKNLNSMIDITGNWRAQDSFPARLQTSEPDLQDNDRRTFRQRLRLPAGRYAFELEYDSIHDRRPGRALQGNLESFDGFAINGRACPVPWAITGDGPMRTGTVPLVLTEAAEMALTLSLCATRPLRTRLHAETALPVSSRYHAIPPEGGQQLALIRGIPFLTAGIDPQFIGAWLDLRPRTGLRPWQDGGWRLDCGDVAAKAIHFAGMVSSIDVANGSWYSKKGDHGYSHFVGDRAGTITVHWSDGSASDVPLIYGLNFWYGRSWDINWHYSPYGQGGWPFGINCDADLFGGNPKPRQIISDALQLVDGERTFGGLSNAVRYIFTLATDNRKIKSLHIRGTPELHGFPLIGGITVETAEAGALVALPECGCEEPVVLPVTPEQITSHDRQPAIQALQRVLYASTDDLPDLQRPVVPDGYFGPGYDFQGAAEAIYAATFLYHNGPECGSHIDDAGTGCCSKTVAKALTHYTTGMGVWRRFDTRYDGLSDYLRAYQARTPGQPGATGSAWGRGVGELLREAVAFGYNKFAEAYVGWLDRCLFDDATPPHWIRNPGSAMSSEGASRRKVGSIEETGNRENDGHGICMWGRYMLWHWSGRSREWNEGHWQATRAAAEWIVWQFETEALFPGKGKDVLYTESECAHGGYDFYSSYNCLHGLKLYIRLAEQLGKSAEAERWRTYYDRLRQGMLNHLVDESPCGPIWQTEAHCDWQDHAHKLAHLHLATEGDSFTPLEDYARADDVERRYLEISRNSYAFLMQGKNYDCLRMYGYGQGMMTQAALLLDEMADAEQFINRLVRYCYLPNLGGWICPEGIIVHRDRKLYVPVNGYMGQDSHLADATKALRVMMGIDDNNPGHLRLVPRFPSSWTHGAVERFPMLTGSQRQLGGYTFERTAEALRFRFTFARPVACLSVRLGPLPAGKQAVAATLDGVAVPFEAQHSGDSDWVWIRTLAGRQGEISIRIKGKGGSRL
jgi:hypothetical protein